jgi:hypothetical protein
VLLGTTPLLAVAAGAAGQSMGAAAERERQKRRGQKTPAAKVYGNDDLDKGGTGTANGEPAAKPATETTPSPQPTPPETTPALDKNLERQWRMRFAAARERVARAEAAAYTTRVETVFVAGIPVQQHVRVFEETEELRAARRALADLEDELRRAGLPPGWGRE